MYLKSLQISGFKSFAKKTVLDFPKGITVVAGPNGSGKSNVVDAIRWALAEQSFKNLRGKKGEDLIFYGSNARGSLALANVAMHFDMADEPNSHLGLSEALVEREINKSGENSYILNGRKIRLTDMEEFLAKSRVGDSSFRVISQGMSDKLLNLSPKEFKGFIEEAAGVKEYQDKRYQAEAKLRRTRENLEKVGAILTELKPQLRVLKREKEKLEKKAEYITELKTAAVDLFGNRYREILAWENKTAEKEKQMKQSLKPLSAEVKKLREELFSFDKKTAFNAELATSISQVRNLEAEENKIAREVISTEGKINLEEERECQRLPVSVEYLKGKIGELVSKLSVDFKGMDVESLRRVMAGVAVALQDLLKAIEKGIDPAVNSSTLPLLKGGLEKLLTSQKEIRQKLEEANSLRSEKEKMLIDERKVSLASERIYREKESELYRLESALRGIEIEGEKLKLHKDKFNQDMSAVGVVTLAEVLSVEPQNNKVVLVASYSTKVSQDKSNAAAEDMVWKLKRKLEEVGTIDEKTIQEYEGANQRFEFLSKEFEDLSKTLTSLEGLVKNLEKEISIKYKTTLSEMSSVFGGYFRLIFGGGKASLAEAKTANQKLNIKDQKLGEDFNQEDDGESGVEIKLDLPNKKIKNLGTLSGGERTLTSIALLFALASIRKPPVMVLDEIDAALDETNTQKFVRLVKELSRDTQFIIITHNRETMRGADALYGVSMKDGISHLLSLKL
ncbi:MAG: AAA family ATPase [bacterium]|nr:AAA family ATPase [bacterium]